jgi:hypothetical protein
VRRGLALRLGLLLAATACGPSTPSPFPTPTPDPCASAASAYAQAVVESWIPACSLEGNVYNDPREALGPPNAAGGQGVFTGFVSLGFGGRVTLDMGGCFADAPGPDLRVYQAVGREPVSVYVSLFPDGPFTLVEALKECGERITAVRGYCDFDIAGGGVPRARYVRVEDGELFPCPGDTTSEGADLDAVQALGVPLAASRAPLR